MANALSFLDPAMNRLQAEADRLVELTIDKTEQQVESVVQGDLLQQWIAAIDALTEAQKNVNDKLATL